MLKRQDIIAKARQAIIEYDDDAARNAANEALASGMDPAELIEEGFTAAMKVVGERFEEGIFFLPHVMAAAEAMQAAISILSPEIKKRGAETITRATVVIGTIEGDIHSIGKDIVVTALRISGYKVVDLGRDVPVENYVQKAQEVKADVVASSALMTITMFNQKRLEEELNDAGFRDNVKTMVGGAPVNQRWADIIGADVYAESAEDAVDKLNELFS